MAQHLPGIWRALRREILASASVTPLEGAAEVARAAALCLRKLVAAGSRCLEPVHIGFTLVSVGIYHVMGTLPLKQCNLETHTLSENATQRKS